MKMQRQPGCWLRSSHTLKECVTAHWSSEFARKITGAKLSTEITDCSTFNNVCGKKKEVYIVKCTVVVEEHSVVGRSQSESISGRDRRENAGISSESKVRILAVESLRFPGEGSSAQGKSGPKERPRRRI